MDKREIVKYLSKIKVFVLDMDGTIYLGDSLFPFTKSFLNRLGETGRDFFFFTNNSSKNREAYIHKLKNMGIQLSPEKMLISNGVIIQWLLQNQPGKSCFVLGTPLLIEDFCNAGIPIDEDNPDYVVLGFDTTLSYERLSRACSFIREGRPYYGVNPDLNCPVENGFIPDCGSIAALIKASTGATCQFFGKPSPHTLEYMLKHAGCSPKEMAVVGDRLYTDIAVADNSEVTSILVMSGETTPELLDQSPINPDLIFRDLEELSQYL